MKRIAYICFFILVCLPAFSTVQIPDKLIYNGKEYRLDNFYLERFFEKNPDKKPEFEISLTALWRGYVATFEIIDNQLFLTDIEIMDDKERQEIKWKSILNEVFPNSKKIKAEWFTGILWGGFSDNRKFDPFDYENYSIFEIQDGSITQEKQLTKKEYKKFKKHQISAFKKTPEYQGCIEQLQEEHLRSNEQLKEIDKQLGREDSYYFELSNKQAKEIIDYRIFDFIPKFMK